MVRKVKIHPLAGVKERMVIDVVDLILPARVAQDSDKFKDMEKQFSKLSMAALEAVRDALIR